MKIMYLIVLFIFSFPLVAEELVVTVVPPESEMDERFDYDTELMKLALDKTVDTDGPYKLVFSPKMNHKRSLVEVKEGLYPNFFCKRSVAMEYFDELAAVNFPVDLGIVGYRVFFVSPQSRKRLAKVETVGDLKAFTMGQGIGWLDGDILAANGFHVVTGSSYDGLFKMVVRDRFDLLPRGINELKSEWLHQHQTGLIYDKDFVLYYPLPRFFFTHKKNKRAVDRIYRGLILAYNDGSLKTLWERHYIESIRFVQMNKRKIFRIPNPLIADLDPSYTQFIYDPEQ